jgi:hypothetical protein
VQIPYDPVVFYREVPHAFPLPMPTVLRTLCPCRSWTAKNSEVKNIRRWRGEGKVSLDAWGMRTLLETK